MAFFDSYLGAYLVQSFTHAWLAFFLIEAALRVWEVDRPRARFRFRLAILLLPVTMFPLFQALSPQRGGFYFRQDEALFVSRHWFSLQLPGGFSFGATVLGFIIFGTSCLVLLQELMPIGRDILTKGRAAPESASPETVVQIVAEHAAALGIARPPVEMLQEKDPIILTAGSRQARIIVSQGILAMLDTAQLRVALAHEMAHVLRRSTILTVLIFLLRLVTFFNPVTLLVFRQLVQDDEQICDDITVQLTQEPMRLAQVLRMFRIEQQEGESAREAVEDRSHNLLLRDRIVRLEAGSAGLDGRFPWGAYIVTMASVVGLSYFVV